MDAHEKRLKRLAIRSWRRGIKEMDLILGSFWNKHGASLDDDTLSQYEELLSENDQDLYQWVSGQTPTPEQFSEIIERIKRD